MSPALTRLAVRDRGMHGGRASLPAQVDAHPDKPPSFMVSSRRCPGSPSAFGRCVAPCSDSGCSPCPRMLPPPGDRPSSTRWSRSDKIYHRPLREWHETTADNASAFISSAITESGGSLTRSDHTATRRRDSENVRRAPQTDADVSVDLQQTPRRRPTEFEFRKTGQSALGTHARRSRWKVFTALRPFQDRIQCRAQRLPPIG
jgi:hypothetical protein